MSVTTVQTSPVSAKEKPEIISPILDFLNYLHELYRELDEGAVATYIPELAKANANWFGICLCTSEGYVYEVGDSQHPFTIQSISKPFVYGLALEDNTRADVLARVGVEPTGDVFNAISLEPQTGRPRNPMVNAGAIATTGMVAGRTAKNRFQRILGMLSLYAGRDLQLDTEVYQSESESGHRNRAIGHMLRNFDILNGDPAPIVDLYFKQCSVSVTCRDLAIMGATLANRGVNPVTGKRAVRGEYVESVLSVMGSCGMYDYAGEWIYRVGMPAKSGVAGGIVAVLPGQFGVGVFSPPLDARGNSVRGIRVCDDLSRRFDLHLFNSPHSAKAAVRMRFSASSVNSSRVRTPEQMKILRDQGDAIEVFQLQGNVVFSNAEVVLRTVIDRSAALKYAILDFKHTLQISESACWLLHRLLEALAEHGVHLAFTNISHIPLLRRYVRGKLGKNVDLLPYFFDDNDPALEWCENRLLESLLPANTEERAASPEEYELFHGLTPEDIQVIMPMLERQVYRQGKVIVNVGDPAGELFILVKGRVSVTITLVNGMQKRLACFSAGMAFGEMALLDQCPRSAIVTADTEVTCDVLPLKVFNQLTASHPHIIITILRNVAHSLSVKLRKANREVSIFDY